MPGYVRHHRYKELFKYPASSVWWMFVPNPNGGKALRESTGQRDDVAAHRVYLARIRAPLDAGPEAKQRGLNEALVTRLNWLRTNRKTNDPSRKKLAEDTIDFYRKKSGTLVRLLGPDTPLSEIDPEAIREYISARTDEGAKGTSIDKELTTLSMAMKLARRDGVECGHVRDMKPEDFKTTYIPKERWLRREEYERFMAWWYAHRAASRGGILDFITSTGATYPSEVHNTGRDDIAEKLETRVVRGKLVKVKAFEIRIRGTKRETRDRTFTIPSDRQDIFERALGHMDGDNGSLFRSWGNIRRDIVIACAYLSMCTECESSRNLWWNRAGVWVKGTSQHSGVPSRDPKCSRCKAVKLFEPFSPTDLRRTFAQWLMQAGVPYELAYPLMGHADDRMLKKVYGKRSALDVGPLVEAALARAPKRAKSRV